MSSTTKKQQQAPAQAVQVQMVAVTAIEPSPYQTRRRFDDTAEAELAESIRSHGVLQPLVVRPWPGPDPEGTMWELVAGERRLRAARRAGLTTVPCMVRELSDAEACEITVLENLQREDLTVMETARSVAMLHDKIGYTWEEAAKRMGKKKLWAMRMAGLLELPEAAQEAMDARALSMRASEKLLAVPAEKRAEAFEQLCKRGLREGSMPETSVMAFLEAV